VPRVLARLSQPRLTSNLAIYDPHRALRSAVRIGQNPCAAKRNSPRADYVARPRALGPWLRDKGTARPSAASARLSARHANFWMERCSRNPRWFARATRESMRLAMSTGRSRRTRSSLLGLPTLIVAIVSGLLAVATIPLEAAEHNAAPRSNEPSPNGSDNLSRKLDNSNGVISPPAQVDPGMTVRPPRDEGSMRIIRPPGSSAQNPSVQPK